ncbi:MAG: hypothetical protein C5B52_05920 [Bacteroidetes bacterium]|nr:MAG: hypothetical protein C5B52_05920 [Bacteroidota bacterium]
MSSSMEPEVKRFLVKILKGISVLVLWLIFNVLIGLYLQWAFIYDHINLFNIIFYSWILISLPAVIYYLYKLWNK